MEAAGEGTLAAGNINCLEGYPVKFHVSFSQSQDCEAGVVRVQGHVTHVLGSGQSIHRDCSRVPMQNNGVNPPYIEPPTGTR